MGQAVEPGRVDITTEISMLLSHLALPQEEHLSELLHIFAYLKKRSNSRMVFDPSYSTIDETRFERRDWSRQYGCINPSVTGPFRAASYVDNTNKQSRRVRPCWFIKL